MRIRRATPPRPPERRSSRSRARGTGGRRRSTPRSEHDEIEQAVATARDHGRQPLQHPPRTQGASIVGGPRTSGVTMPVDPLGILLAHGEPRARRRLGRGRLGHPRPAARRRRAARAAGVDRARPARRLARSCLPSHSWAAWPTFLTGAGIPPGTASSTSSSTGPGPRGGSRSPTARSSRRPGPSASRRRARRPCFSTCRSRTRRPRFGASPWLAAWCRRAALQPSRRPARRLDWPINGGSWTTFRHRPLDLVAELEGLTRRRAAATRPAPRRGAVGRSLHRLRLARPAAALPARVRPSGHPRPRRGWRLAGGRSCARCLPPARRELGTLVERTDDDDLVVLMSDHGHQPCTRALSMNKVWSTSVSCASDAARPS